MSYCGDMSQEMEKEASVHESEVRGLVMFVGEYVYALDPKKRLTIPSVWRAQLEPKRSLYVLPDLHDQCLYLYPGEEFMRKLDKIRQYGMRDKQAMRFASVLGSSSDLVTWDTQGRIRINDKLLQFAGLTKQVVLVGAFNKIELWNPEIRPEQKTIDQNLLREASKFVDF